jgi:hypothetical protein
MARDKPRPLSVEQQKASNAERVDRDVAAGDRQQQGWLAARDADDARISKLQQSLGVTRFEDIPAVVPLLEIDRTLRKNLERLDDERELISVERYLSGAMSMAGVSAPQGYRAQRFTEKRDKLRAKLQLADVEPAAVKTGELPGSVVRALEVFSSADAGKNPRTEESRLVELQNMQIIVEAGFRDVRAMLDKLRSDAAFDQAKPLQKRHAELLVALFRAGQRFSEAAAAERDLRTALTSAGYVARTDLLPAPAILSSVLTLGHEADWQSQISEYRRFLQQRKLLP